MIHEGKIMINESCFYSLDVFVHFTQLKVFKVMQM